MLLVGFQKSKNIRMFDMCVCLCVYVRVSVVVFSFTRLAPTILPSGNQVGGLPLLVNSVLLESNTCEGVIESSFDW